MPRYFFNLINSERIVDDEGSELPDLEAARVSAIVSAREILREDLVKGELPLSLCFRVTDESGALVFTLPFKDAVSVV